MGYEFVPLFNHVIFKRHSRRKGNLTVSQWSEKKEGRRLWQENLLKSKQERKYKENEDPIPILIKKKTKT